MNWWIQSLQMKLSMGSATGGSRGSMKTGGPVIGLDPPPRFFKNIKILCENKKINNSFENSSLVVTVSKHFSKFSEICFSYTQNNFIFSYIQNF